MSIKNYKLINHELDDFGYEYYDVVTYDRDIFHKDVKKYDRHNTNGYKLGFVVTTQYQNGWVWYWFDLDDNCTHSNRLRYEHATPQAAARALVRKHNRILKKRHEEALRELFESVGLKEGNP